MIYLFAAVVTLAITALAVLVPLSLRGGRAEVRDNGRWLLGVFALVVVVMISIAAAFEVRLGAVADLMLGVVSAGVAAGFLLRRPAGRASTPRWYSTGMLVALAISVGIVVALVSAMLVR
ncbi:MAG TPA: hypothetical protein VF802_07875 [Candidatus Limnocylindrales bacterium]